MTHNMSFSAAALAITLLFGAQARADFLGLAPGDYNIELLGSSAVCGGSNCVGQVHIPSDPVSVADFDWSFVIGANVFSWEDTIRDLSTSPNGLATCALESSNSSADCQMFDDGFSVLFEDGFFLLFHPDVSGSIRREWAVDLGTVFPSGAWVATPAQVSEPHSLLLLGGGALSALWFWRRTSRRGQTLSVGTI
jgi:hypothetical protein